jgi:dephospho-CoA kinase
MPFVVGLTGNIATGKSTILQYLASRGAHIIDADKVAHRAMEPGGPAYQPILEAFGSEILDENGWIDRKALGRIVFADAAALQRLEAISHPAVYAMIHREIAKSRAQIVVIEAIKLLEGQTHQLCDEIWVVTARPETQLQRLMEQRGMTRESALQRMRAQPPQAEKVRRADRVIENDGSPADLHRLLDILWSDLQRSAGQKMAVDP